ncbi:wd40 repeat protein [Tubulinosema ratisbonensis]|uniref:Wd40 repeat protein n=1 Tax=Tubulinosema ratisbonensis TaxID=291195 RepID=A0A437AL92_9MICR|nr:wd40 repeat-like protein [Tubulinosema ratisbonensis]RVD91828.1 wd40 repeat protein [Tubulinosema ratisbonensis]
MYKNKMTTTNSFRREKFIKPDFKIHDVPVVYKHWQLRDMLKHHDNRLIFPKSEKIISRCLENGSSVTLLDCLYNPATTFDVNDSFVVVGNSRGDVILYDKESEEKSSFSIGGSIINSLKLYDNYLFICSNEKTLTMYDLIKNKPIAVYTHDSQVNNCAISSDGNYLIACGDTRDVVLFETSNNHLEYMKTVSCVDDGGFGISWNASNSLFAVGTQDGFACIWDTRWDKRIKTLRSYQFNQSGGAIRNLQFTKKNFIDVLVWTEHTSCFSVVDTRTFKKSQTINVNEGNTEKYLNGLALNEENDKIFIATNDNTLEYSFDFNIRRVSSYGEII